MAVKKADVLGIVVNKRLFQMDTLLAIMVVR
jgi:hypothetical protein